MNMQKCNRKKIGHIYEALAAKYLSDQGLKIILRNFVTLRGEIDLICLDKKTIVFVEVRFRTNTDFCIPAQSIDYFKQVKISKTAALFLKKHPKFQLAPCRFDVIAITLTNNKPMIDWIPNAFYSTLTK